MATTSNTQTSLKRDGFILRSLVSKDFKLKYRRSILGILWSVLNPLLMMVVLTAVFSYILRADIKHYPLYLILGQILFNFVQTATSTGMTSIIEAAPLIKKIRVKKYLFPLQKVVFELLNFALSLIAVVMVMAYFMITGDYLLTVNIVFLPLLMVYVVIFCIGLSLLLSSLAVFFRDVIYLWGVFCLAWMYATPIFYPDSWLAPWMQAAELFNPMFHYVGYFRQIALYGTVPSLMDNALCLGIAIITLLVGYLVFNKTQKKFILYV